MDILYLIIIQQYTSIYIKTEPFFFIAAFSICGK